MEKHILGMFHGAALTAFWFLVFLYPQQAGFVVGAVILSLLALVVFIQWVVEIWTTK